MARINPGDPGGGGGGGTGPTPGQQAESARRLRGDIGLAEERVAVVAPNGEILEPSPLQVKGGNVAVEYDAIERRTVVTLADVILFGTAAARPATPANPCIYIATDSGAHSSWDGTTWRTI